MAKFDNQIALVTGASGGIGGAIAAALAAQGATVLLVGRSEEKLAKLAERLGERAVVCPTDLVDAAAQDRLVATLSQRFGRLDILVHSAGMIAHERISTASVETLGQLMEANVHAPCRLTQKLIGALSKPRGQIVFINSSVGLNPSPAAPQFSMTQHAFKAMADTFRDDLNGLGIKVLTVYPGRTATPRIEKLTAKEGREYKPELLLQPEDVAEIVAGALGLPWTAEVTNLQIRPMLKSY